MYKKTISNGSKPFLDTVFGIDGAQANVQIGSSTIDSRTYC